jgi:Tfp pilus assembly PilM family ATPase
MGCWDLPAPHRSNKATHLMAVGLPHARADALLDAFESARLQVDAVDVAPCALARACAPAVGNDGITAILDLGWTSGVLSLLHQGAVIYGRVLADAGVAHLHTALARRLGLDDEVIEYLLAEVGFGRDASAGGGEFQELQELQELQEPRQEPQTGGDGEAEADDFETPDDALALLAAHADGVARELQVSFSYATHQYPDAPITKVLLVGGGAAVPGFAARLSDALGVEAAPVTPTDLAECESSLLSLCGSPALTAALGLALFPEL